MIRRIREFLGITPATMPGKPAQVHRPQHVGASLPQVTAQPYRSYFEALNVVDHRTPIPASYGWMLAGYSRLQLAQIARYLWDNVGMVFYATDLIGNYSTPMTPRAATTDRRWNEAANALFDAWAIRADYTGRTDFAGVQRALSFNLDTDGEGFAYWLDDDGTPRVQVLDSWRIAKQTSKESRIDDGVQLDAGGRAVGYWLDNETLLSADTITHLAEWDRLTGFRGISPIRRGSNHVRDGNDILGFQKVVSKLSTTLAAVIQGEPVEENPWGTPAVVSGEDSGNISAATEAEDATNDTQRSYTVAELLAGDIPTLPEGQELKQVLTPSAPGNNIEVISYLAGCFVAGMGLPPAFFLDEKLTGPNQRAVNGKAQKRFDKRKAVIGRLARDAWLRVISRAIESGALPAVEGWDRCDFISPARLTIDAGREMAQEREDVATGLMSRREHYGARGKLWQRETDQVFEELDYILDRAKAVAAEHGLPVSTVAAMFGIGAKGSSGSSGSSVAPDAPDGQQDGSGDDGGTDDNDQPDDNDTDSSAGSGRPDPTD